MVNKLSVLIPARNEQFLAKTIEDIFSKARGEVEIICHLDGYWPSPSLKSYPGLHIIHRSKSVGMRRGLNSCVAVATGNYVMKLDGHCMLSEGFDTTLISVCRDNWVCVPTRHRLDPENWVINNGNRPPINYLRIDPRNDEVNFMLWNEKNRDRSLDEKRIDDILSCQGSCYFLPRKYWEELELLDEENYGTFRKDPQEVTFKAWLSGGRVVRVKDAWYAHLHKGKRYGRGYSANRSDWKKGDEYVKRWFTDSAWDKQTKPMSWLLAKFSDMPGWEDHKEEKKLTNLYQVLSIGEKVVSKPKPDRTRSKFWNEGKWETFIAPLLPGDCSDRTFVEMGANAGLFLKLANDWGYRNVVGIEKDRTPVKEGLLWRDTIGGDWRLLKRRLGGQFGEAGTFNIDELPVADTTLLSTFHYYVDINAWVKYIDRLAAKTCTVLLVSRPSLDNGHWLAQADYESVCGYFKSWTEIGHIDGISKKKDSKPRDLYAVKFRSPLIHRVAIEDINSPVRETVTDLAQLIASGEPFDLYETEYVKQWRERKHGKWSEKTLRRFVDLKMNVMQDVKTNGLRDPIVVQRDGLKLSDGGHRLAMLRALGYKSVIAREI